MSKKPNPELADRDNPEWSDEDFARATGPGWQTRIDAALSDWLKTHSPG